MEWMTQDWRSRIAAERPSLVHSNLAAVYLDEGALKLFNHPALGYSYPLPRLVYGRVVRELKAQGARIVAFDILFLDRASDRIPYVDRTNQAKHQFAPLSLLTNVYREGSFSNVIRSDQFCADRMADAGNVILAVPHHAQNTNLLDYPLPLFRTNAAGLGHVVVRPDADGIHRRIAAFRVDTASGQRVWAMGIMMAAAELGLDLDRTRAEAGCLVLQSTNRPGVERRIPVDEANRLLVDWVVRPGDRRILPAQRPPLRHPAETRPEAETNAPVPVLGTMWDLVLEEQVRQGTQKRAITPRYQDAIVLVGSVGTGRNVSDRGATPLHGNDFLFTAHWNVANSLLTDRFVRTASLPAELGLAALMVTVAGLLTWRLRALWSSLFVLLAAAAYIWLCAWAYTQNRLLLPLVLPIGGALLMTHVCMVAYRMIFEQAERRRIKSAFSKVVAPDVLDLILEESPESLTGTRRELTVLFADVRNFTGYIDDSHARLETQLRARSPTPSEIIRCQDENARHTMAVINEYLGVIAGIVKEQRGTVDKFIGDSVMAFWGAPPPTVQHAAQAVRAAIATQQAMLQTNADHVRENERREAENLRRAQTGEPSLPLLPALNVGIGIHTGTAIAGFMGSRKDLSNYTVFGRDVIIANRLESMAEPGVILVTEATRSELTRTAPELAALCRPLPPVNLKGIGAPVLIFRIDWRDAPAAPSDPRTG